MVDGRKMRKSLGETTSEAAEKRVREIIDEMITGHPPLQRIAQKSIFPTLLEVLDAYEAGNQYAAPQTLRTNRNALTLIAKTVNKCALTRPITQLTRQTVETWWRAKQGRPTLDRSSRRQINVSLNSTYKHARDVFAKRHFKEKFGHLRMPDLADFLTVPLLPEPKQFWQPIDSVKFNKMVSAADELRRTDYDLWLCNLLLRRLGLRNKELAAARANWIVQLDGQWSLVIQDRESEGFYQKGTRPRSLPLAPDLIKILKAESPTKQDAHLLMPDATKTDRLALIERRHSTWLRTYIPDRTKANHELRKHVGSIVLSKQGLAAAQRFLGHASSQTTERWYATYLQQLPTITDADLRSF
jgi:integrase